MEGGGLLLTIKSHFLLGEHGQRAPLTNQLLAQLLLLLHLVHKVRLLLQPLLLQVADLLLLRCDAFHEVVAHDLQRTQLNTLSEKTNAHRREAEKNQNINFRTTRD